MKKILLITTLFSSTTFAAGSKPPSEVNPEMFEKLKSDGITCVMTSFRKRERTGGTTIDTGVVKTNALVKSVNIKKYQDDSIDYSMLLDIEGEHGSDIGWFNFPYSELKTVTEDRIRFEGTGGYTRVLDIDLNTGEGKFLVKATMGGWPINKPSHHRQDVTLEDCDFNY